jgi:hypothetical protein
MGLQNKQEAAKKTNGFLQKMKLNQSFLPLLLRLR